MKSQTFNIALPRDLVLKADEVAKKEYRNRSELIREALRVYIQEREELYTLLRFGREEGKKAGIKKEEDVNRIVSSYRHGE